MAIPADLAVNKPQHGRLHYLDNLKAILVILVILHHAGQPYGRGGWWYVQDSERTSLLGPYFWLQASFFMGLMFFLSAYFVPRSLDRKGAVAFLVEHLLVYSVLYVLLRAFAPSAAGAKTRREGTLPGDRYLVGYILAMSAVTLLVRKWYPVDSWLGILGFIQSEPAHLPQYVSMFFLGAAAFRRGWLDQIPLARGLYWLAVGFAAFVIGRLLPFRAWWGGELAGVVSTFAEGFVAVGLSVGLLALAKTGLNRTSGIWKLLSGNSFAAYLFHVPVVLVLQSAALALPVGALVKFAIVSLIAVPATFGLCQLIRKLPLARSIL